MLSEMDAPDPPGLLHLERETDPPGLHQPDREPDRRRETGQGTGAGPDRRREDGATPDIAGPDRRREHGPTPDPPGLLRPERETDPPGLHKPGQELGRDRGRCWGKLRRGLKTALQDAPAGPGQDRPAGPGQPRRRGFMRAV